MTTTEANVERKNLIKEFSLSSTTWNKNCKIFEYYHYHIGTMVIDYNHKSAPSKRNSSLKEDKSPKCKTKKEIDSNHSKLKDKKNKPKVTNNNSNSKHKKQRIEKTKTRNRRDEKSVALKGKFNSTTKNKSSQIINLDVKISNILLHSQRKESSKFFLRKKWLQEPLKTVLALPHHAECNQEKCKNESKKHNSLKRKRCEDKNFQSCIYYKNNEKSLVNSNKSKKMKTETKANFCVFKNSLNDPRLKSTAYKCKSDSSSPCKIKIHKIDKLKKDFKQSHSFKIDRDTIKYAVHQNKSTSECNKQFKESEVIKLNSNFKKSLPNISNVNIENSTVMKYIKHSSENNKHSVVSPKRYEKYLKDFKNTSTKSEMNIDNKSKLIKGLSSNLKIHHCQRNATTEKDNPSNYKTGQKNKIIGNKHHIDIDKVSANDSNLLKLRVNSNAGNKHQISQTSCKEGRKKDFKNISVKSEMNINKTKVKSPDKDKSSNLQMVQVEQNNLLDEGNASNYKTVQKNEIINGKSDIDTNTVLKNEGILSRLQENGNTEDKYRISQKSCKKSSKDNDKNTTETELNINDETKVIHPIKDPSSNFKIDRGQQNIATNNGNGSKNSIVHKNEISIDAVKASTNENNLLTLQANSNAENKHAMNSLGKAGSKNILKNTTKKSKMVTKDSTEHITPANNKSSNSKIGTSKQNLSTECKMVINNRTEHVSPMNNVSSNSKIDNSKQNCIIEKVNASNSIINDNRSDIDAGKLSKNDNLLMLQVNRNFQNNHAIISLKSRKKDLNNDYKNALTKSEIDINNKTKGINPVHDISPKLKIVNSKQNTKLNKENTCINESILMNKINDKSAIDIHKVPTSDSNLPRLQAYRSSEMYQPIILLKSCEKVCKDTVVEDLNKDFKSSSVKSDIDIISDTERIVPATGASLNLQIDFTKQNITADKGNLSINEVVHKNKIIYDKSNIDTDKVSANDSNLLMLQVNKNVENKDVINSLRSCEEDLKNNLKSSSIKSEIDINIEIEYNINPAKDTSYKTISENSKLKQNNNMGKKVITTSNYFAHSNYNENSSKDNKISMNNSNNFQENINTENNCKNNEEMPAVNENIRRVDITNKPTFINPDATTNIGYHLPKRKSLDITAYNGDEKRIKVMLPKLHPSFDKTSSVNSKNKSDNKKNNSRKDQMVKVPSQQGKNNIKITKNNKINSKNSKTSSILNESKIYFKIKNLKTEKENNKLERKSLRVTNKIKKSKRQKSCNKTEDTKKKMFSEKKISRNENESETKTKICLEGTSNRLKKGCEKLYTSTVEHILKYDSTNGGTDDSLDTNDLNYSQKNEDGREKDSLKKKTVFNKDSNKDVDSDCDSEQNNINSQSKYAIEIKNDLMMDCTDNENNLESSSSHITDKENIYDNIEKNLDSLINGGQVMISADDTNGKSQYDSEVNRKINVDNDDIFSSLPNESTVTIYLVDPRVRNNSHESDDHDSGDCCKDTNITVEECDPLIDNRSSSSDEIMKSRILDEHNLTTNKISVPNSEYNSCSSHQVSVNKDIDNAISDVNSTTSFEFIEEEVIKKEKVDDDVVFIREFKGTPVTPQFYSLLNYSFELSEIFTSFHSYFSTKTLIETNEGDKIEKSSSNPKDSITHLTLYAKKGTKILQKMKGILSDLDWKKDDDIIESFIKPMHDTVVKFRGPSIGLEVFKNFVFNLIKSNDCQELLDVFKTDNENNVQITTVKSKPLLSVVPLHHLMPAVPPNSDVANQLNENGCEILLGKNLSHNMTRNSNPLMTKVPAQLSNSHVVQQNLTLNQVHINQQKSSNNQKYNDYQQKKHIQPNRHSYLQNGITSTLNQPYMCPTSSQSPMHPTSNQQQMCPTSVQPQTYPTLSRPQMCPTSSQPLMRPTSSQQLMSSTSSQPPMHSTLSKQQICPTSSQPLMHPTSSQPQTYPTLSKPQMCPTSNQPPMHSTLSKPQMCPTSSQPLMHPTSSQPQTYPTLSKPQMCPTSSQPQMHPTSSQQRMGPTSSQPPMHPTSRKPQICPTSSQPLMHPTTSQPQICPASSQPPMHPTSSQPQTCPTLSQPHMYTTSSQPYMYPTSNQPLMYSPTSSQLHMYPILSQPNINPSNHYSLSQRVEPPPYHHAHILQACQSSIPPQPRENLCHPIMHHQQQVQRQNILNYLAHSQKRANWDYATNLNCTQNKILSHQMNKRKPVVNTNKNLCNNQVESLPIPREPSEVCRSYPSQNFTESNNNNNVNIRNYTNQCGVAVATSQPSNPQNFSAVPSDNFSNNVFRSPQNHNVVEDSITHSETVQQKNIEANNNQPLNNSSNTQKEDDGDIVPCDVCKIPATLMCSKCFSATYCSKSCAEKDPNHHKVCKIID